jgi:hypothetical protein
MIRNALHTHRLYSDNKQTNKLHGLSPRERTIPTERPPLVDEVIANTRIEGATWSA